MAEIVLILHKIRSVHNTASIFRTSDGAGVSKIYLTGYTPDPLDKFNNIRKDFHKVALGAEEYVNWCRGEIFNVIKNLKCNGFEIVALEQSPKSIPYTKYKPAQKVALILGNEVEGISEDILNHSDKVVEIPMKGHKKSLNVSVAAGIMTYYISQYSTTLQK